MYMTELQFVKRIHTEQPSIFYSIIEYKGEYLGFARKTSSGDKIKCVKLDSNFTIEEDNCRIYKGEDPRVFLFNNELYILDNTYNALNLIQYSTETYIPIPIGGKNLSFFTHNDRLYFIHYIKPFVLFEFELDFQSIMKIHVKDDGNTYNYEYRGGTPGYPYKENQYYGYGHRTYHEKNMLIHDIFKWIVDFTGELPSIQLFPVKQPLNSKNICDPTCVVSIDGKSFLVTAESDTWWYDEQDYVTNVYEISDGSKV